MANPDATAFHPLDPRAARSRLIYAAGLGGLTWALAPGLALATRALLAGDVAALVLLSVAIYIISFTDPAETRRRAAAYDPGRRLVWFLVIATGVFGLFASAVLIRQGKSTASFQGTLHIILCVATVVISWVLTHASFTLRYAHLYYRGEAKGGISFPGEGEDDPDDLDFAYFAFTIGMTFQVSDNNISRREIRKTVLRHALLSFVYNTVIVALALNLVVGQFT